MTTDLNFLLLLLGCALVTMIPRILPFIIVRNFTISKPVEKWLSYIPVCIFTALVVESIIHVENNSFQLNWDVLIALIPTCLISIKTKSLLITVLAGVITMALVRFLL